MRYTKCGWIVAAVLFLSGCYNKDFNEPGRIDISRKPTTQDVRANFERTWAAAQQIFSRFPVLQQNSNGRRAFIITDWIRGHSDVLYSGYGDNRVPYPIRYKLYVYVTSKPGTQGTEVRIENVEEYRDDFVTAGVDLQGSLFEWIRTESSTLKEARLIEEIEKLARSRNLQP